MIILIILITLIVIKGEVGYKVPDKDFYRKMMTTINGIHNSLANRVSHNSARDRLILQPHCSSLR